MFSPTYFSPTYFAPTYWPPGPAGSGEVAAGLIEALAAYLDADATIAAVSGGKARHSQAPLAQDLPALVFTIEETATLRTWQPGVEIETIVVRFHCRASAAAAAHAAARSVKLRLLGDHTFAPPKLLFADGREVGRYSIGPAGTTLDPERSQFGLDSWVSHFPVTFKVARG